MSKIDSSLFALNTPRLPNRLILSASASSTDTTLLGSDIISKASVFLWGILLKDRSGINRKRPELFLADVAGISLLMSAAVSSAQALPTGAIVVNG